MTIRPDVVHQETPWRHTWTEHHWTFASLIPGQRHDDVLLGIGFGPATVLLVCHCGGLLRRPLPESVG